MPQTSNAIDAVSCSDRYDVARAVAILLIVAATCVAWLLPMLYGRGTEILTRYLLRAQDLPLVPIFLCAALLRPTTDNPSRTISPTLSVHVLVVSILLILGAGWLGHYLVFQGFYLSRDEQMAVFDQQIFAHGQVLWPIPADWRDVADALGRRFMLPIGANEFWVSGYLPVHAASRSVIGLVLDPALTSPLFTALAACCSWALARRLWPGTKGVVIFSLIILVTSSQALITSMTAYSMSMHLGLNLLWLLLFLKNRWQTHLLAVVVGFFATGIHQPLFHPLFALPFCVLLLVRCQWRVAGFYVVAYSLIAAVWMWWPLWIVSHGVAPAIPISCANANCSSGVGFVERLLTSVQAIGFDNFWMTAANFLRFVVWQHPLLLPLALFGTIVCWRSEPLVRALAISFVLPIVVMAVILPWQGHGWGYRYVHPVLGNAVLLACFGFNRMEKAGLSIRRPLILTTVVAIALVPVHAWMANRVVAPFKRVQDDLMAIQADVIVVDTEITNYAQDVVVNRFDLSNRPKLMIAALLKPADLPALCQHSTIAFHEPRLLSPIAEVFGRPPPDAPSREVIILRKAARALGCEIDRHNTR